MRFAPTSALLVAVLAMPAVAEERKDKAEAAEAIKLAKEEAAKYVIDVGKDKEKVQLRPEPILRWTSLLNRRFYGDVFLWTHKGRPAAVITITNLYSGNYHGLETEAHSLSLKKFNLTRDGKPFWNPTRGGVELRPIPGAPKAADSPTARLRQMRGLARQFSAVSTPRDRDVQLRLLPQPVYRYKSTDPDLKDGAMFAFVLGTDPEVFLLVEARQAAMGFQWQYALARFNGHVALRVAHHEKEAWKVRHLNRETMRDANEPYFAFHKRIPKKKRP